jgi:hypothetical protein
MIHPPKLSGSNQQTPNSKAGETLQEMSVNFSYEVPLIPSPIRIFNML